jgi:nicotinate-nucleotide--dimethylbenzimidazole phosphoribosyltransferase
VKVKLAFFLLLLTKGRQAFFIQNKEVVMTLSEVIKGIGPVDQGFREMAQNRVDQLIKPVGSMGLLEDYFVQLCAIQCTLHPKVDKRAIIVLSADHGVVAEGVAVCDASVTLKQTLNFVRGYTGVCALAKQANARIIPVDIGVCVDVPSEAVYQRKIRYGTGNIALGPAMSREEAVRSLEVGIEMASMAIADGCTILGTGEMGIGNTTPSSAMLSVFGDIDPSEVTGMGANLPDEKVLHKIEVIKRALAINVPDSNDPLDVLTKVGGLDIGGMAGVMLGAAYRKTPVIVDGFISTVAAILAVRLCPEAKDYMIPSHKSREKGARFASALLGLEPPLDMQMRLGEGTGAALMFNILEAAIYMSEEMITFDEAGIDVV